MAQSVERLALGCEVVGLNLPAVPEVTLSSHSSSSLTIPMCKMWTKPLSGQSELTLKTHYSEAKGSAAAGASTLA